MKKKTKFSSYIRKFRSVAKEGLPNTWIWGNAEMRKYLTIFDLATASFNFPYIWEKLDFLFYQCTIYSYVLLHLYMRSVFLSWWVILACELPLTIKHILIQLFRTDYTQFFVKCWLFLSWFSQLHPRWISVPDPWFVTKAPCWLLRSFNPLLCTVFILLHSFSLFPSAQHDSFIQSFIS